MMDKQLWERDCSVVLEELNISLKNIFSSKKYIRYKSLKKEEDKDVFKWLRPKQKVWNKHNRPLS